jgi:uncharacterized 2Fe-2S/4Fe-4S cluster protein (DUF4445 family)
VAGIPINNICGGEGVCGKCRVLVKSGKVTAQPTMYLTRREIQRGMALACQTYVDGDAIVEVPLESRIGGVPQLASEDAVRFGRVTTGIGNAADFAHRPLCRKELLQLPPPTDDDCLPDEERLYRELRRRHDIPVMQTGLSVLRRLPSLLRKSNWCVTALVGWRNGTIEVVDVETGDTSADNYGVAVDIGTTTVVAHLVNLKTTETISTKAKYNSQVCFGDDVIARIMCASSPERRRGLREIMVDDLNDLIAALVFDAGIRLSDVTYMACAGNTTMVHLLYGLDPSQIRRAPYVPCASCPPVIRAAEVGIGIHKRGLLAVLPSVSSYVGGDVVADVLVSGMMESEDVSLLIDLGTNGELVVGNSDWLVCCSASAGPAFEGGGITCGMRATDGAIERMHLGPGGIVEECGVVGGTKPLGLCGSGLIDTVGELLRVGCIDRRGRFVKDVCGSRLRIGEADSPEFILFSGEDTSLGRDIFLSEADINNLIHSKGSIYMGAECLLDYMSLTFADVKHVYIAGGFGNYLDIPRAISIGLLPDLDHDCFHFVGNGSVQGAKMCLLSIDALQYVTDKIAAAMTHIELSTYHRYMNEFSACLFLPHTNIEKFPSVQQNEKGGR